MVSIIVKRGFGILVLLIGITVIGWVIYNQSWPTDEFRRNFQSVFQLILPAFFIIIGWKWLRYDGKGIEEVTPSDITKCPELDASIAKARDTISVFLAEVDKGIDDAYIKFPIKTPQGLIPITV